MDRLIKKCRCIDIKKMFYILLALYLLSIIPLLAAGFYDFPSADDFSFAASSRNIWVSTHNIFAVFAEAAATSAGKYMTWQGTYTSIFFMALQPAVFGVRAYAVTPFIMTGMLTFSVFYFVRTVFRCFDMGNVYASGSIAIIILEVILQGMVNPVEGLYWYNGAVHYILPFGFMLFLLGLLISIRDKCIRNDSRHMRREMILAVICAAFTGGGNLVSGLIMALLAVSFITLGIIRGRSGQNRSADIICLCYLVFFVLNIIAPGNYVRSKSASGMPALKAIAVAFYDALAKPVESWTTWFLAAGLVMAVPLIWHCIPCRKNWFRFPILVALYSYCLLAAAFVPGLYSVGNSDAGRIQDLIWLLYICLLFINEAYILGWIKAQCAADVMTSEGMYADRKLSVNQSVTLTAAMAFIIFGLGLTFIPSPEKFLSSAAIYEVMSGQAGQYRSQMLERNKVLESGEKDIVFTGITVQPHLLYHSDITEDKDDWTNAAMARFYGKDSVVMK
jgi:hypothetical protein